MIFKTTHVFCNDFSFWAKSIHISYVKSSPQEVFLKKRCSEIIQQIYMRKPMLKYDFNFIELYWSNFIEITLWYGCSTVNVLYFFRTAFPKSTYEGLLLLRHFIINTANIFANLKTWVLATKIFGITVKVYLDF